ncbi:amino acid adenylation domain-containing protein, partial [Pseudomonas sp. LJDD11]
PSGKQLAAYLVSVEPTVEGEAQNALRARLREHLKTTLPDYMVPAHLLFLAQLPLSPNGKLDRKALPKPQSSQQQQVYVAPQTVLEQQIAAIWAEVLKLERVGLTDNFFELGGDSIISIQVVSRARQVGIYFTPKALFQHQTVQGLASVARDDESTTLQIDQGPVTGQALLLPIQQWFFDTPIPERHHWNQAVLLTPNSTLQAAILEQALQALISHHDALRLSFIQQADQSWTAHYRELAAQDVLWQSSVQNDAELQALCTEAQTSLNLQQGPLLRAVLASLADGRQRLLLAIHHLAVDGVSWRILLEDLQAIYAQLASNQPVSLPAKTSSTQAWADRLQAYASSEALQDELGYWQAQLQGVTAALPCDNPQGALRKRHLATVHTRLDQTVTRQLLQQAPLAYRTQVNDLLLTALARVIARWTADHDVLVQLEGHGREELFDEIDLTRTVGWFTSMFPVRLSAEPSLAGSIKRVKEQLRAVPDKGIGFGALRYLGSRAAQQTLAGLAQPRITFNYLGQLDNSFAAKEAVQQTPTLLSPAQENYGAEHSLDAPLANWLSINGQVYGGELRLGWSFSREMFRQETIERLADEYAQELEQLVEHCISADTCALTPSDVPLAGLNQAQLDDLPVAADEVQDLYPLSAMQQGMLFHSLYDQGGGEYINQIRVDIQGLDVERFRQAWQLAVDRHEVLRASFVTGFEQPLQVIRKRVKLPFTVLDWSTQGQLDDRLERWALDDREQGFDLLHDPLLRLAVIRTGDNSHHLIYTSHHILMDGWSNSQLLGEVLQSYAGQVPGHKPGRYRDYIDWLLAQDRTVSKGFWEQQLQLLEEPTRLAQALSQDKAQLGSGFARHYQVLDAQCTRTLNEFARKQRVTVNTLVQAAWLLLLQRYTGLGCVTFGATVSGRPADLKGVEQQLGLFINTLPVIAAPRSEQSVGDWVAQVQAQNLGLREHEHTPLYEIQQWAGQGGEGLFDNILVFENYPVSDALQQGVPGGLVFSGIENHEQTNYPLTLAVGLGETLSIDYSFDRAHFSEPGIEQVAAHFAHLLQELVRDALAPVGDLPLLSAEHSQQIINECNSSKAHYPAQQCLHQFIEQQVSKTPDATAVAFDQALSYDELNRRANRLAHKLREQGVGPDVLVGLAVERSLEMVVGLLAILKAGGAYVPLDPEYPQERLSYLMQDSGIGLLLTQSHLVTDLPVSAQVQVLNLDEVAQALVAYSEANPVNLTHPDNLAYVIYTSGSTGKPKGTLLAHHNVVRLFQATEAWFQFNAQDVWTVFHSYAFDFSVWELYGALLYGGKAVIVPKDVARSPESFHALLKNQGVTVLNQTPSAFKQLIPVACNSDADLALRYVVFGGEALDVGSLAPWFERFGDQQPQLINMYGITETTVHVTYRPLSKADLQQAAVSPIGEVIPDLSWYLLDGQLNPAIPGVQGELHIGRAGLARGYHNRAALTAERFIPNPFDTSAEGGSRLYRSGDLGRSQAGGVVEYAGRIDHQVKIRGFRIELGEIEARVKEHPGVREAVVLDIDGPVGKQLVAYLVPDAEQVTEEQQAELRDRLRAGLKAVMPDYMVPAHFVFLESLPLTGNGKLDRRALPTPDASASQQVYVAPRTELEQQVAAIWAQVLKIEQVGLSDNFFELGGHSLMATQMISQINAQLGIDLPLRLIFETPMLSEFSLALENHGLSLSDDGLSDIEKMMNEMAEV